LSVETNASLKVVKTVTAAVRLKMHDWILQDWTMMDKVAEMDDTGLELHQWSMQYWTGQ